MANLKTKELEFLASDGWQELGDHNARDTFLDIYNESDHTVRMCFCNTTPNANSASIPLVSGANFYLWG